MLRSIEELALFGGPREFPATLHVGRPNIPDRDALYRRFDEILDSKWLTNRGSAVKELEREIAELLGVRHCLLTCNATRALEIAIRALGLQGEIIVPSFTFIATAHAVSWLGLEPVFVDIDPRTHMIDPDAVERAITSRTTGIIPVNLWGRTCDIDSLERIAKTYELRLLFDSSQAFLSSYRGRMIGNFGDAEVFSFHATKVFNTFEGGAIVTNDASLARRVALASNYGFEGYDRVVGLGTNGKMSEVCAAAGLCGLTDLQSVIAANCQRYHLYQKLLGNIPGVTTLGTDPSERTTFHYVVAEIDPALTGLHRDDLIELLHAENVIARRYFYPGCHRQLPYRRTSAAMLPHTEAISDRVLALPTGPSVSLRQVSSICDLIRFAAARGPEITERLRIRKPPEIASSSTARDGVDESQHMRNHV